MKQHMSVGFADLSNFDRLLSAVGDEKMVELLQACLNAAGEIIVQHGGQIRKYIGDAILFSFADPRPASQAVKEIAQYRHEAEGLILRYYAAIATGAVLVVQLGHPSYIVEDILGETVNRAAKLLKQARQSESGFVLCEETQKYA